MRGRKWVSLASTLVLVAALASTPAAADPGVTIVVNGQALQPDVPPQIVGGRTMVPLRFVAQALGASVSWDAATQTVSVQGATGGAGSIDIPSLVQALRPSVVGVVALQHDAQGNPAGTATGSGIILSAGGLVVSNAHVVAPTEFTPDTWYVEFADGSAVSVPASNIWSDSVSDLAFLKTGKTGLTPAVLGDSDGVTVGQPVIAIGNPLGYYLRDTVTRGIISGVGRFLPNGGFYYPFLQTDAAINPGNSGGALVDASGKVIGITSIKLADVKIQGLGFAIPANTLKDIENQYLTTGGVSRPFLGATLSQPWQVDYGLPSKDGLSVTDLAPNGPAAQAGLQVGDQVLSIDGTAVRTSAELIAQLWKHHVGDAVTLQVVRNGAALTVTVTLGQRPASLSAAHVKRQPTNDAAGMH